MPSFLLIGCFPHLNESELVALYKLVSNMEVKDTIFSMGVFKALGLDGLHDLFYQSQWDVVGKLICFEVIKNFETLENI